MTFVIMGLTTAKLKEFFLANLKLFLTSILSLLLVLLVLIPALAALPGSYTNRGAELAKLKDLKEKSQGLNELIAIQQSVKAGLSLVDKALPSAADVPSLMTQIQSLATSSGVTLRALQFGGASVKVKEDYQKFSLIASFEGSFQNFFSFIENVETTSRMVNVESVSFDSQRGGGQLSVSLSLASFYLPLDEGQKGDTHLDLKSPAVVATLDFLKGLKVYEPESLPVVVGKDNPFE